MKTKLKKYMPGYLFILPSFLILLVFSVIPIFMTAFFSFTEYNILQAPQMIGLKNYLRMLKDPFVQASLKNTFIYTLVTVPIQTVLALLLAAVIATKFRNKFGNFVKSGMFVPSIASAIMIGTVWNLLLATDGGAINQFLDILNIEPVNWLGQIYTSLISICIVAIWKNTGYFLVIFYAGIMDIPSTLYEAAHVDGADIFQQFYNITLPSLKPITYLVVTLGIIWSFQTFDLVYTMTGGGPGKSTITLVLNIYKSVFKEYNMGYASAQAVLLFLVVMFFTAIQKLCFKEER